MEKSQNGSKRRFKALDVIIAVVFLGILFAFMFLNIITPPMIFRPANAGSWRSSLILQWTAF